MGEHNKDKTALDTWEDEGGSVRASTIIDRTAWPRFHDHRRYWSDEFRRVFGPYPAEADDELPGATIIRGVD